MLLAIDTTASAASVAIIRDGFLVAEDFINCGYTHSQTLMPMIDHCLQISGIAFSELDAFAVAAGPGSFTGVRIGVATIKGLALPEDKPCVPVSTLEALAENIRFRKGILCPVMDARCSQVYYALFESDGQTVRRLCPDGAKAIADLEKDLKNFKEDIIFVGDGADLCYNSMKSISPERLFLAPAPLRYQRASSVAMVGERGQREGKAVPGDQLTPYYLRLPQAERELKRRTQEKTQ